MPIPGIDTIVNGAIKGIIGTLTVKGRTTHFSQVEANSRGNRIGAEVENALRRGYSLADLRRVYPIYKSKLISYLPQVASIQWGVNRVQNTVIFIRDRMEALVAAQGREPTIGDLTAPVAQWIFENIDSSSASEFQLVFQMVTDQTLVPAFTEAGITPPRASASGGVIVETATGVTAINTVLGLFEYMWVKIAAAVLVVGGLAYYFLRKR